MDTKPQVVRLLIVATVPIYIRTFLRGEIEYLKSRGFEVHCLCSPGDLVDDLTEAMQVPIHQVELSRHITPIRDLVSLLKVWRIMWSIRPHIVHSHTPKGGLLGTIAAWLAGVPVRVYTISGLPFVTAKGLKRAILIGTERISCLLANQVLCISRSNRDIVVSEGLCPPDKVNVLLHGSIAGTDADGKFSPCRSGESVRQATLSRLGILPDAIVLGFVGRIVRDKGVVELVEAWQFLREEYPNLHLLVVGHFEEKDPVPAETEAILHRDPRVHLTGFTDDTPSYYASMDVFIHPTYREGFGEVQIEAAAMSLPVVASRVPGCVDAVQDGVTGTLVPPGDSRALTNAIRLYLNNDELRHQHGEAGRSRVLRDFRTEDINIAYYNCYMDFLKTQFPQVMWLRVGSG